MERKEGGWARATGGRQRGVSVGTARLDGGQPATAHLVEVGLCKRLFFPDEERCNDGDEEAVPEVTEHDREQEREGDDAEGGRVDLAVVANTVCVDDDLQHGRGKGRRKR